MNRRRIFLVLGKELREALRDRRTLFVTLILPMLLYPVLLVGFGSVAAKQQAGLRQASQKVAVQGAIPDALRARFNAESGLTLADVDDPEAALRAGDVQLVLRVEDGFEATLAAGGTGVVELLHDSAVEPSAEAQRKASVVVSAYGGALLEERLAAKGLEASFVRPVRLAERTATDVATAGRRGARLFGPMLSMLLLLMLLTGSFTPAVDIVAGEKERGTMETLLVSPATRAELVLGKFLAVFALAMASALGNLLSMGLTFGKMASTLARGSRLDFGVSMSTALTILAVTIPLAALFSALALALSSLARSTKEAQTYLTPLLLACLPGAMIATLPTVELTAGMAAVPVAGAALFFRDLLLAQGEGEAYREVMSMLPLVIGTTALAAGLSLRWATWMFSREAVLMRDPGRAFSLADLRPVRREGATPGPGGAVFLPVAVLALTVSVGGLLPEAWHTSPWTLVGQQLVMVLAVVAGIRLAGLDGGATLGLRRPGMEGWVAGLLAGAGSTLAVPWLHRLFFEPATQAGPSAQIIGHLVTTLDPVTLVALLAFLPAVCEEVLFRGWCLRGLRREMSVVAAVALSSVAFGAFHLEPQRILFTGLLGAVLAVLALRTGSLWPGVIGHAIHNGATVIAGRAAMLAGNEGRRAPEWTAPWAGESALPGLIGVALITASLALVLRTGKPKEQQADA